MKPLRDRSRPLGTELSPDEAATVARFDAAPDAEEALRERVARAIAESDGDDWDEPPTDWGDYYINADAAIAAICNPVEQP